MKPSQIIVIGTGRLACACLESCLSLTSDVQCIEPENAAFSTFRSLCQKRGVKYQCATEREVLSRLFLDCAAPTLVVSAYNSFIFPKAVLANRCLSIVNFHNSLLPRHRGRNAPTWTIFEMDAATGVTWHQVSDEIDRGGIICQSEFEVPAGINAIELTQRTLDLGASAFREILPSLLAGSASCVPAGRKDEESFHRSTDVPNGGILDLGWSVTKAHAFLRSLDYGKLRVFPIPRACFLGECLNLLKYDVTHVDPPSPQGAGAALHDDCLVLHDGAARLTIQCSKR